MNTIDVKVKVVDVLAPVVESLVNEAYEQGHREGEACHHADWVNELGEIDLPEYLFDNGGPWPSKVAEYIAQLQFDLKQARANT